MSLPFLSGILVFATTAASVREILTRRNADKERKQDSMARLTDEAFRAWCQRNQISPATETHIQRIRSSQPVRKVRSGASNVSGRYPSVKMGCSIQFESQHVELWGELKQFLDSGIRLFECPECARMRSLSPHNGVLRFPSHDRRKRRIPQTERRWAMGETTWEVVEGERKEQP